MRAPRIQLVLVLAMCACSGAATPDLGDSPGPGADAGAWPDSEPGFCDESTFTIEHSPVNLMIALDLSGSMAGTKYDTARTAIGNVLTKFAGQMVFGFDSYPDDFVSQSCSVSGPVAFDCQPNIEADISNWLNTHSPTSGAGDPLVRELDKFIGDPGYAPNFTAAAQSGGAYLVIVADGDDCCGPLGTYNCSASYVTEAADRTAQLLAMGIKTIPVGYTVNADPATMNAIAQNGGTPFSSYILAEDAVALEAAFDSIAGSVVSCVFDVTTFDASEEPDKVNVYMDGQQLEFDASCASGQGWTWVDETYTAVRLCSDSCDVLGSGGQHDVRATFGCPTTVVE